MKRSVSIFIVTAVLFGMITALAAAGSDADPLITRKYAEGDYRTALRASIAEEVADPAALIAVKAEVLEGLLGFVFAEGLTETDLDISSFITLIPGTSFVLSSGAAKIEFLTGAVIDISNGEAVKSGDVAEIGRRYFCAENTTASVLPVAASKVFIDGYYRIGTSELRLSLDRLSGNEVFKLDEGIIYGLLAGVEMSDFRITPEGFVLVFADGTGSIVTGNGPVCTSYRLRVMNGDKVEMEYTLVVTGDVSGDGGVRLVDLLMIQKHLLLVSPLSDYWYLAADVNFDGVVSLVDLLIVQRYLLGVGTIG